MIHQVLAIWSLVPLSFLKPAWAFCKFTIHELLKAGLENFEHYFTSVWDECNCALVWTFFGIAFLWDWNENWLFPVLWPLLLPKAHLTLHSMLSGSRWVITPLWLSGLRRSFLYSYSVYSCPLFLISSASVRSIPFLSFIEPIFVWNVPLVSLIFLNRSLVCPILLFSSISLQWWLRKAFLSLLAVFLELYIQMGTSFLLSFAFHFSSFHSCLWGLLRQPFCFFAFLFLGEKGMENHFSILALRTPSTVWKGKKIGHWKMYFPGR